MVERAVRLAIGKAIDLSSANTRLGVPDRKLVEKLREAYETVRDSLLSEQLPEGYWLGELPPSALSTATAVSALSVVSRDGFANLIAPALEWLESDQNRDGGWGDTPASPSNVPTTMLVEAALCLAECERSGRCIEKAEGYLRENAGRSAEERVRRLRALYGADRTFAVPILANCALAACAAPDEARVDWTAVPRLPFELACCPRSWFRGLRLHVVSYALPALIAIGQLIHARRPTRNPILRVIRNMAVSPSLRRLEAIQPSSGGFLEAIPLTSFVVMSLAAAGHADHPAVRQGIAFIERTVRTDGSWPIDSNLSNWVTTLAISALTATGERLGCDPDATRRWLLDCQHRSVHPYTDSPPGGWGWTHLPGGVPDADDTAGALLALAQLDGDGVSEAAAAGVRWLLDVQNSDGGWPTFCRGWGKLPFDRSAPDLTAHALRAISTWGKCVSQAELHVATSGGFRYLADAQRSDGAWVPLWFGNQQAQGQENPVYGTTRVLAAYDELGRGGDGEAARGVGYLVSAQNPDSGWGGDRGVPSSIEETALAVDALSRWIDSPEVAAVCSQGARYLADQVANGDLSQPAPIGLYFARLWYSERLYPIIWTVSALGRLLSRWETCGLTGH